MYLQGLVSDDIVLNMIKDQLLETKAKKVVFACLIFWHIRRVNFLSLGLGA